MNAPKAIVTLICPECKKKVALEHKIRENKYTTICSKHGEVMAEATILKLKDKYTDN